MKKPMLLATLLAGGILLSGETQAQTGARVHYPDGTVVQLPAEHPGGGREDVEVTGSTASTAPPEGRERAALLGSRGCSVRMYAVAPSRAVRVVRC